MLCNTTLHAAAYVLMKSPFRAMAPRKLASLLYIAERMHARTHGHLFTYCNHISTPDGPIQAEMRDVLLKGYNSMWWKHLMEWRAGGNLMVLRQDVTILHLDHLSEAIIGTLDEMLRTFGRCTQSEIYTWMVQNCSEWNRDDPEGEITSLEMFRAVGSKDPEARAQDADDQTRIHRLFKTLGA